MAMFLALQLLAPHLHTLNASASVDLHNHLFMNEGMSWMFQGNFYAPLKSTSWKDKFYSRMNGDALQHSDLQIVVVALYAHPLMTLSLRDSIHRQIDQAEAFVADHPEWVIARKASEAALALSMKKRVLVLSLETAAGILETEKDLEAFIDHRGISIVTFMHLTADHYGGVAFLKGSHALASPIDFLKSLFSPHHDDNGVRVNPEKLSDKGREMVEALIKRKVWIDLAHSSDATQKDLYPILKKAGQPHLYTHTTLRRYFQAERSVSDEQLRLVAQTKGMIGLIPSVDMVDPIETLPKECGSCPKDTCQTGLKALAEHFRAASLEIGSDAVVLGSDLNAPLQLIPPTCNTGTDLDQRGFYRGDQIPQLWKALRKADAPIPEPISKYTQKFIATWRKVRP